MKKLIFVSLTLFSFNTIIYSAEENDGTPDRKKGCYREKAASPYLILSEEEHFEDSDDEEKEVSEKIVFIEQQEAGKSFLFSIKTPEKPSTPNCPPFFIAPSTFDSMEYQESPLKSYRPQSSCAEATPVPVKKIIPTFSRLPSRKLFERLNFSGSSAPKQPLLDSSVCANPIQLFDYDKKKQLHNKTSHLSADAQVEPLIEDFEEEEELCEELARSASVSCYEGFYSTTPSSTAFEAPRGGSRNSSMDSQAVNKHFEDYSSSPVNFAKRNFRAANGNQESRFATSTPVSFDPALPADQRPKSKARRSTPEVLAAAAVARKEFEASRAQSVPPSKIQEKEEEIDTRAQKKHRTKQP